MTQSFDPDKQRADESEQDWIFGALSQPGIVSIPQVERTQWLPQGEVQFSTFADFSDCASRSPVNHYEALFTYHYRHNMKPENKKWFEDKGYVVVRNGLSCIEFSDRYIAVLSGTTHTGNSLKAPLETIRTKGLIPKALLPKEEWMTWADYHDPKAITQKMQDLGEEFLEHFVLNYERVRQEHIADALKDDMIGVACYAWDRPVHGVYQKSENGMNHAVLLYDLPAFQAYDNYFDYTPEGTQIKDDYTKNLAPDYLFYEWGYRAYIGEEKDTTDIAQGNALFSWLADMIGWLTGGQRTIMPVIPAEILPEKSVTLSLPTINPIPTMATPGDTNTLFTDWNGQRHAYHNTRVLCDRAGLSVVQKNLLCACIWQESQFNVRVVSNPNANGTRDWGLCQFNDGKIRGVPMWIGAGAAFSSTDEVLNKPEKCVNLMIKMLQIGHINWWVSYTSGAYKKFLDPASYKGKFVS